MLLHLSTWAETEAYLQRSKTVVIPIGSNEQHGPTGLLGTDWLCPEIIAAAKAAGVGVMGIRAVQAGALTNAIDRTLSANYPDQKDYDRAAPFRALCAGWGEDPAVVAHRYALGIEGVDTLVLGVKNRAELQQCLDAEAAGPLAAAQVEAIDALGLRAYPA